MLGYGFPLISVQKQLAAASRQSVLIRIVASRLAL
jgi:hypothetical protein